MRRWTKLLVASVLALVAALAIRRLAEWAVVRSISRPEVLRVYIGPCPYAWLALEQVRDKALPVIPLPVEGLDAESRAEVCAVATSRLDAALRALPDAWLCEWLAREGESYFARHFVSYPSASWGLEPVDRAVLAETLAEHGINLREGDAAAESAPVGVINLPVGY